MVFECRGTRGLSFFYCINSSIDRKKFLPLSFKKFKKMNKDVKTHCSFQTQMQKCISSGTGSQGRGHSPFPEILWLQPVPRSRERKGATQAQLQPQPSPLEDPRQPGQGDLLHHGPNDHL